MNVEERTDKKGRAYYFMTQHRDTYTESVYGPSPFVSATVFPCPTSPDWMSVYIWWQKEGVGDYNEVTGEIIPKRQRWVKRYLAKRLRSKMSYDEGKPYWLPVPLRSITGTEIGFVSEAIYAVERFVGTSNEADQPF